LKYWFLYDLTTGEISGSPYYGNADEWTNIPDGCGVLGPFVEGFVSNPDVTTNELPVTPEVISAYHNPKYYLIQGGKIVAKPNILDLQLADAKQAKIQEIIQAYQTELNGTFTSSATGTPLVYDFSPESQTLWKELSDAINANYIPDTMFPMNITLANGTTVPHTKLQLQQIFREITARKLQLYSKLQSMVTANGTIMSATTIDEVNAIKW
jgi:hypothetical protein